MHCQESSDCVAAKAIEAQSDDEPLTVVEEIEQKMSLSPFSKEDEHKELHFVNHI